MSLMLPEGDLFNLLIIVKNMNVYIKQDSGKTLNELLPIYFSISLVKTSTIE